MIYKPSAAQQKVTVNEQSFQQINSLYVKDCHCSKHDNFYWQCTSVGLMYFSVFYYKVMSCLEVIRAVTPMTQGLVLCDIGYPVGLRLTTY